MRRIALLLLVVLAGAVPALAQTNTPTYTPTPTPTGTPGFGIPGVVIPPTAGLTGTPSPTPTIMATMTAPSFSILSDAFAFPTPTEFPVARATLFISLPLLNPGDPFIPPTPPDLGDTRFDDAATGFTAISTWNQAQLMDYLVTVAMLFWQWLTVNFPRLVAASRWLVIIMIVLYGVYMIWRGSKFVPPDSDPPSYFSTFRQGGRYYYYTRGYRDRVRTARRERDQFERARGQRQERLLRVLRRK